MYSGVGSFGIECISRGAENVTFVEKEQKKFKISDSEKSIIYQIIAEAYSKKNDLNKVISSLKYALSFTNNNQNIRRIELISSIFKQSNIIIPFREPIQHSYSLLTQHKKFIEESKNDKFIPKYMKWIGHTEFGPNYIPIHDKNLTNNNDLDIKISFILLGESFNFSKIN